MFLIRIDDLGVIILHSALQGMIILQMHMSMYHIFGLILVQQTQKCLISLMSMIIAVSQSMCRRMGQQDIKAPVEDQLMFDM